MINAAGGTAVAVRVDHTIEAEVKALFQRIEREHGRVDVLVNSVAGEDPLMGQWASFWEADLTNSETILRQGLLSHIITAKHAAPLMMKKHRGLILEVTENDTLIGGGNILAQIVKVSHKALAAIWAVELRPHGVACAAITPGFLRSERMLEHFGVSEENWREGGKKDRNFLESESPLFVGRAAVALAQDPNVMARSGHLFSSWELSREYGFTDADGRRPDWGALDVDYSQMPASLLQEIADTAEMQSAWLKILLQRTERFQASLTAKMNR
jgi:NAD(P)-dependent dehydrogenase (short-subunit alcohol dehydrogenase family)